MTPLKELAKKFKVKEDGRRKLLIIRMNGKRRKEENGKFKCGGCKKFKEINDFHKSNNRWNGISSKCKDCLNEIKRKKYFNSTNISLCRNCYSMTKSVLKHNVLFCLKCEGIK